MRTSSQKLRMGLLTAALVLIGACGRHDVDWSMIPLADEAAPVEPGIGGNGYLWTRPVSDRIVCVRAPCPSYIVHNVNTGNVEMVYAFDLRALRLQPSDQEQVLRNIDKLLLYGRYTGAVAFEEPVQVFQILYIGSRVSEVGVDEPGSDRYYRMHAADATCLPSLCAPWTAQLLNRPDQQVESWSGIDLARLELNSEQQQLLLQDLQAGRAYVSTPNAGMQPVPISEAFRQLPRQPLP